MSRPISASSSPPSSPGRSCAAWCRSSPRSSRIRRHGSGGASTTSCRGRPRVRGREGKARHEAVPKADPEGTPPGASRGGLEGRPGGGPPGASAPGDAARGWEGAVRGYLRDGDPRKRLDLADRLARVYDQCLLYRPDWIREWEQGAAPHWQARLWQRLVEMDGPEGPQHWVRALDEFRATFRAEYGARLAGRRSRVFERRSRRHTDDPPVLPRTLIPLQRLRPPAEIPGRPGGLGVSASSRSRHSRLPTWSCSGRRPGKSKSTCSCSTPAGSTGVISIPAARSTIGPAVPTSMRTTLRRATSCSRHGGGRAAT